MNNYDLITILGPTACGKTSAAVALATEVDGEIVSAAYFYHDKDSNEVVWVDIPEDRVEDLVTDLDSAC